MPCVHFESPILLDLTERTLALGEPGVRVIDAKTGEHIASVLPDADGSYDCNCLVTLAEMMQARG